MGINPNPKIENTLLSLPLHALDSQVERIENSCYSIRRMFELVNYELPYNDCRGIHLSELLVETWKINLENRLACKYKCCIELPGVLNQGKVDSQSRTHNTRKRPLDHIHVRIRAWT